MTAEKTEKTTVELELDMNQRWEWSMCQEDGANLEPVFGPGFTGIINIGSSCYISSCIQLLLLVPDFISLYGYGCEKIFSSVSPRDSFDDFNCQTAKVVSSLLSGEFSKQRGDFNGIKPLQFRRVVGLGHSEFSTNKQQDAEEYLRHFLSKIDENIEGNVNPVDSIRMRIETRFEDCVSKKVKYDEREDFILSLNVPLPKGAAPAESAKNTELRRYSVKLEECLAVTFSPQVICDYRSPITNEIGMAEQTNRITTFPDYLLVQLKKFVIDDDWSVRKMDADVEMPEELDLEAYRGRGIQPGEELLPNDALTKDVTKCSLVIDESVVNLLQGMGFSREASRKAVYMTKNTGIEAASDWIMNHIGDVDLNEEHPAFLSKESAHHDENLTEQLVALGFTKHQANYALQKNGGNVNSAAEWLFANADSIPDENLETSEKRISFRDGPPRYRLKGFISHMGKSPHCGHYVAHVLKKGKWYLFNDEKVAVSRNPPTSLGYIYLYQRI
ncbi:hypothetical protein AB6A40_001796 [Gnathostoma spinigerum]|uniref:Ubiquitin carboxyl-terminal hydrolase n=1 Tax=Gnathostoma spinigerum TaxID=75299 RepID=A0ABD6E761_9BILA